MKKYMIVAVAFLVLGAVIGAIVLFGGEEKAVGLKKVEFAKTVVAECRFDSDCEVGLECFHGSCSYPCRGPLMCPVGRLCDDQTGYCVRDLSGRWRRESDGETADVRMLVCEPHKRIDCYTGLPGICGPGKMRCLSDGSAYSGICEPSHYAMGPEVCDNEADDDCDGETDEGCDGPGRFQHCWTLPAVAQ